MNNEIKVLEQKTLNLVEQAKLIKVEDEKSYEVAGNFLTGIVTLRKEIERTFTPMKKKAHAAWKEICNQENYHLKPLEDAVVIIKGVMSKWYMLEQKKRREEEARLAAELKKKQEEEALKLAQEMEDLGDKEEAENILTRAEEARPVVNIEKPKKVEGITEKKITKWRLKNENQIKRQFLKIDEVKINAAVRAMGKDAEQLVGGIEVYEEIGIAAGGR